MINVVSRHLTDYAGTITSGRISFRPATTVFPRGEEASRWISEFRRELNQIDHVLVSFSLRQGKNISIRILDVPVRTEPSMSDHRPPIVTINVP